MSALSSLALAAPTMGAEDIRDIRAPFAIPDWWRWPVAVAAALALAIAVVLAVRYVRKRRARPLTPHERALAALRIAETHAREGRSREWADVVAETIRYVLSTRLGADVLPKTTSELAAAWTAPFSLDAAQIIDLLETCDLARFARASLDDRALLAQTATARAIVEHLFEPAPIADAAPSARVSP